MQSPDKLRAFISHAQAVNGPKVRERSPSFKDHYSQATLFWNSQSEAEKEHLVEAAHFELGKVETMAVRERIVEHFNRIDNDLAVRVARGIGVREPSAVGKNHGRKSDALSIEKSTRKEAKTRKVAVLCAAGVDAKGLATVQKSLKDAGVEAKLVSKFAGKFKGADGTEVMPDKMFVTTSSVEYDAVLVPGGKDSVAALRQEGDALHFLNEAYRHCKPISAFGEGIELINATPIPTAAGDRAATDDEGVVLSQTGDSEFSRRLIQAISQHRFWNRGAKDLIPA